MIEIILAFTVGGIFRMYTIGTAMVFYMVGGTTIPDTGAYFVGRTIGKHKLNERISPNKTIEGSVGGYVAGLIFCLLYGILLLNGKYNVPMNLIVISAILLPVIGQIGDLTFSAIKRHYGIKDFSNLFPGHGGVLDRIDSISFNCIILYALMIILL